MTDIRAFSTRDRQAARQFVADWYGFDRRKVHIAGLQADADGNMLAVHFAVYAYTRQKYLARRRTAADEWELILLP